jgi:hypothetical protein
VGDAWLAPAPAPDAIAPEVVQPAAKGSISGVMRDVIQKMKESDVKSFSILASQLFETDWILERGKKYKGMTKAEAQAAFIQDFGQRMQDAKATQPSPVAASSDGKPKKLSETLRGVIDAMKASDERLEDIGEQIFDLRRRAIDLELEDVGELPPPARKALVAAEVSNAPPFVLPADLSKAAPRYGNKKLQFESDLDRAAYMLASDRTKGESKAAQKYREALAAAGFSVDQVAAHGAMVKKAVKDGVKDADGATAVIPVQPFGGDTPRLPLPEAGSATRAGSAAWAAWQAGIGRPGQDGNTPPHFSHAGSPGRPPEHHPLDGPVRGAGGVRGLQCGAAWPAALATRRRRLSRRTGIAPIRPPESVQ